MGSFRVGIGFEAVGGSAQELWDRGQVPITLLGVDVAEVDRQVGEQCLHILPLLIPVLHPSHREGMTKRGQARGALPRRRRDRHALAQPCKPIMQGTMVYGLSPLRHEKRVREPIVVQAGALRLVMTQALSCAGMQGDNS